MDPSAAIAEQAAEYQAKGIWLDVWPGQTARSRSSSLSRLPNGSKARFTHGF
jgi:hypothetical protein